MHIPDSSRNVVQIPGYDGVKVDNSWGKTVNDAIDVDNLNRGLVAAPSNLSVRSLMRLQKELKVQTKTDTKHSQNARRFEANNCIFNFIAFACVAVAIWRTGEIDELDLRFLLNIDKTSSLFEDAIATILLSSHGVKEELKQHATTVTTTKSGLELQRRGMGTSTCSDGMGKARAFVSHVKDYCFVKVSTYRLDKLNWLMTIPVSKGKGGSSIASTASGPVLLTVPVDVAPAVEEEKEDDEVGRDVGPMILSDTSAPLAPGAERVDGIASCAEDDDEKEAKNYAQQEADQLLNIVILTVMKECIEEADSEDRILKSMELPAVAVFDKRHHEYSLSHIKEGLTASKQLVAAVSNTMADVPLTPVADPAACTTTTTPVTLPMRRIVLTSDGERCFMKAVMDFHTEHQDKYKAAMDIIGAAAEFMKYSAACSKTQQAADLAPGYRNQHQFVKTQQYRHFDIDKCPRPAFMNKVDDICKTMERASYRTFERFFYASQHLFNSAYSQQNNSKGWVTSGLVRGDQKPGPDVLAILLQCPMFAELCPTSEMQQAVVKQCWETGLWLMQQKSLDSDIYLGTVCDRVLKEKFSSLLGNGVDIQSPELNVNRDVTQKEFINWRASMIGGKTQRERFGSSSSSRVIVPETNDELGIGTGSASIRKGKLCSNGEYCPDSARYYATTCSKVWSKCLSNCQKCVSRNNKGGSVHVCPNAVCKEMLRKHMADKA